MYTKRKDNSTENLAKTSEKKIKNIKPIRKLLLLVIRKMKINTRDAMFAQQTVPNILMNSFIIPCTRTSIDY